MGVYVQYSTINCFELCFHRSCVSETVRYTLLYSNHIVLTCSLQPTLIAVFFPTNTSSPQPLPRLTERTPSPSVPTLNRDSLTLLHLLVSSSNKYGNRDYTRLSQRKRSQHLVCCRGIFFPFYSEFSSSGYG